MCRSRSPHFRDLLSQRIGSVSSSCRAHPTNTRLSLLDLAKGRQRGWPPPRPAEDGASNHHYQYTRILTVGQPPSPSKQCSTLGPTAGSAPTTVEAPTQNCAANRHQIVGLWAAPSGCGTSDGDLPLHGATFRAVPAGDPFLSYHFGAVRTQPATARVLLLPEEPSCPPRWLLPGPCLHKPRGNLPSAIAHWSTAALEYQDKPCQGAFDPLRDPWMGPG